MTLTHTEVKNAKPRAKPYKMSGQGGLFLLVNPNGGKWWRFKYSIDGREKLLSLGIFPDVSVQDAHKRRDDARKLLATGVDPGEKRKAVKASKADTAGNTFEVIAREWAQKQSVRWTASNNDKVTRRLERDVFPWLGQRPVDTITAPEILRVMERIEKRGTPDTAHRALQSCGQIFRYAIASGFASHNPCPDLKGALIPVKKQHFPAITEPKRMGELMHAIHDYQGEPVVRLALQLAPLVFLRPGELRNARWEEIDFKNAVWNIPAQRMKIKTQGDHIVPLSQQVLAILEELHPITGHDEFVFPSTLTNRRPMSDNTLNAALRRMGFPKEEMTGHGFRAMARTILDEVLKVRPDYIEHQLAHAVRDPNGRDYNRPAHLDERRKMMQIWADYVYDSARNS